jgi:hypothetical protein
MRDVSPPTGDGGLPISLSILSTTAQATSMQDGRNLGNVSGGKRSGDRLPVPPAQKSARRSLFHSPGGRSPGLVPQESGAPSEPSNQAMAHAILASNTVQAVMSDWHRRESEAKDVVIGHLESSIQAVSRVMTEKAALILNLQRRNDLMARHLADLHGFIRMIHLHAPQVREMFDQDYEAIMWSHAVGWDQVMQADAETEEDTDVEEV